MSRYNGEVVRWKTTVPRELALNIELLLIDEATGQPAYSSRSTLITHLLQTFWDNLPEDRKRRALGQAPVESQVPAPTQSTT